MKGVVINELDLFLHRPNLALRAQYYAVVFLNQLLFTAGNAEVLYSLSSAATICVSFRVLVEF